MGEHLLLVLGVSVDDQPKDEASPYRGGRTLSWLKVRQRDYRVEMNHRSTIPSEPRDEAHHHTWGGCRNPKTAVPVCSSATRPISRLW